MNVRQGYWRGLLLLVAFLTAVPAHADVAAGPSQGELLLVVGGIVAAIVIWLLIRGALNLSGKDTENDDAGVGTLEGIDEDDEDGKKRR